MILDKIVDQKKIDLEVRKVELSIEEIKKAIADIGGRPSFYDALKKDGLSIIGEVKKASPSKGIIKADFHPVELGKKYESCVDAVSVLTEEKFFLGSPDYLKAVNSEISLPTIRKDFIIDEYQIYEAKYLGASAILLICAILDVDTLRRFRELGESLGLDSLVECHTEEEVKMALESGAKIVGINNRNLKTFEIDLETTVKLSKLISEDKVLVSESGIHTGDDIEKIKGCGVDAVLVGESFMVSEDMAAKAKELKGAFGR